MTEIDTSPAALRRFATGADNIRKNERAFGGTLEWWHDELAALLRALAAEKEAAVAAFDAASRDAHLEIVREKDATIYSLRARLAAAERMLFGLIEQKNAAVARLAEAEKERDEALKEAGNE